MDNLLVVYKDKYKDLPLATVAMVEADPSWKSQIHTWGIATLADGRCNGSGYGHKIIQKKEHLFKGGGHKVVVNGSFKLMVVSAEENENLPLATVAIVQANSSWKSQIAIWGIAELADGRCDGSGYGHTIHQLKQDDIGECGTKVVVKFETLSQPQPIPPIAITPTQIDYPHRRVLPPQLRRMWK